MENTRPLNLRDPFNDSGDVPTASGNQTFTTGHRFATAAAGSASITLVTAGDAANYTVGMRVLLHGYDHQFSGYPPNPRYFEYKVVASVAGAEITFTEVLDFTYDDRWPEGGLANHFGAPLIWGKPRILSLERPNYLHPRFVWLRGPNLPPNPLQPAGRPSPARHG